MPSIFTTLSSLLATLYTTILSSLKFLLLPPSLPSTDPADMKSILILGGSYGGLSTAHRLLKTKGADVKVTVVAPNTHFYWNLAAPRALISGQFTDDKIFQPIEPGFKNYPAGKFEFVLGTAESLDLQGGRVSVTTGEGQKVLSYDVLILATGTKSIDGTPFKGQGSHQQTLDTLAEIRSKVKAAKSIYVVGAGATGVETAGELGFEYGAQKSITLISSGPRILESAPEKVSVTAAGQLAKVKVTIKTNTKVSGSAKTADGRTELTLSDGQKITTDLYIPTTGLTPNTSYVPQNLLNANGFVMVDEYLGVKGAQDVWAVGDVADVQRPQYVHTEAQSVHVAKNIIKALKREELVKYVKAEKDMLAVPVGRKAGTGHFGNFKLPSFMVNMVKGKTLFTEKLVGVTTGTAF